MPAGLLNQTCLAQAIQDMSAVEKTAVCSSLACASGTNISTPPTTAQVVSALVALPGATVAGNQITVDGSGNLSFEAPSSNTGGSAPPNASDTVAGVIQLNTGLATSDDINSTDAMTATGFTSLATATGAGTPNAIQLAIYKAAGVSRNLSYFYSGF